MAACHDLVYLNALKKIVDHGSVVPDRTGTGCTSLFDIQMKFDLRDRSIPMLTSKKMFTRGIIVELLWFLTGNTNIKPLLDQNVHIWDAWADEHGDLGPIYGAMWRRWPTYELTDMLDEDTSWSGVYRSGKPIDQIAELIHKLKTNPYDRRLVVSAWNVGQLSDMALPPCHMMFECYARPLTRTQRIEQLKPDDVLTGWTDEAIAEALARHNIPCFELSMKLHQRSADFPVGVPFNIVQYSILLHMLCHVTNMLPGDFIWDGGNCHIYHDQMSGVLEQLKRTPFDSPTLSFIRDIPSIDDFAQEDFIISGYQCHPTIKYPVAT